jgi:cytochrome c biogenesis factor
MSSFKSKEDNNESLGALVSIVNLQIMDSNPSNPGAVKFVVTTAEKTPVKDYIVLQVIEFPWINLVWGGTILMVLGFSLSVNNRISQYRKLMNA